MKISIVAVGRRPPAWAQAGFEEYAKRLPPHLRPDAVMVENRSRSSRNRPEDIARAAVKDGESLLQAAGKAFVIALDRPGRHISTEQFADSLSQWQMLGRDVAFLIGGADGLSPAVIERADQVWSLSNMVFAHHLARLVLVEQLYRAWSITQGSPYHRGEAVKAPATRGRKPR